MAHAAATERKLELFLVAAAQMPIRELAQQYLICGESLLEIEDVASARANRALIDAIDAIGKVKFPREWEEARENIGHDQDVGGA